MLEGVSLFEGGVLVALISIWAAPFIAVLRGNLVPRSVMEDRVTHLEVRNAEGREDCQNWRKAAENATEAARLSAEQVKRLADQGEVTVRLIQSLPRPQDTDPTPDTDGGS